MMEVPTLPIGNTPTRLTLPLLALTWPRRTTFCRLPGLSAQRCSSDQGRDAMSLSSGASPNYRNKQDIRRRAPVAPGTLSVALMVRSWQVARRRPHPPGRGTGEPAHDAGDRHPELSVQVRADLTDKPDP